MNLNKTLYISLSLYILYFIHIIYFSNFFFFFVHDKLYSNYPVLS